MDDARQNVSYPRATRRIRANGPVQACQDCNGMRNMKYRHRPQGRQRAPCRYIPSRCGTRLHTVEQLRCSHEQLSSWVSWGEGEHEELEERTLRTQKTHASAQFETSCLQIGISVSKHVLIRRPQQSCLATFLLLGSPRYSSRFGIRRRTPHAKGSRHICCACTIVLIVVRR